MFRLIQESLNNTAKHSQAKRVEVKLEFKPNKVLVMVADDGIGFEQQTKVERPQFGIMGMQERVKLLQGTMKIKSKPGEGTALFFGIPLRIEENEKAGGSDI